MSAERLDAIFMALADPTRRAILSSLTTGEKSVKDLAKPFDMTLPAVTKHLKVLERAGLISRAREAQWRPCKLNPEPLREVMDWMAEYRRLWDERMDRLENYLLDLQAQDTP